MSELAQRLFVDEVRVASKKKKKRPTAPAAPVRPKAPAAAAADRVAAKQHKQEKQAARRQAQRRAKLVRVATSAGVVILLLAVVGGVWLVRRNKDAELRAALTSGSCEVDTEADRTRPPGQNHVPNPTYSVNPPSAGDHLDAPARGGVYSGASVPADGALVHSLEHGYIIVWHQPDLPAEQLEQLRDFERDHDGDVIVAERAGMPVPVAATAWQHRLLCQQVEIDVLERFFDARVGDGPEDVPRG